MTFCSRGGGRSFRGLVRTDAHQLRPVAGDSPAAEGLKVAARAHQTLIWERHRHALRLRSTLREYFPAALEAFDELTAPHTLELLTLAPDPARARRLTRGRILAVLRRTGRRNLEDKTVRIHAGLRREQLAQPDGFVAGHAAVVLALVGLLKTLTAQIDTLAELVVATLEEHADAAIYRS